MALRVEVLVYRGGAVESSHMVHAAVVDAGGRLLAAAGDGDRPTFARSAAKPLQAVALVASGAADRFGFTGPELALACASHAGTPEQAAAVASLLVRLGLGEADLACGLQAGRPTPLHHNCSGKHAAMLAVALHHGWPTAGYAGSDHPVQALVRRTVAELTGLDPDGMVAAVDGCSVPTFALPLRSLALGFARLAVASDGALARLRAAMVAHPEFVAGEGLFDTALIRATGGRVVGKSGAEGVFGAAVTAGWPGTGGGGRVTDREAPVLHVPVGLALKVEDGAGRAVAPAAVALLRYLGFLGPGEEEALFSHARPVVYNHRGLAVGRIEAVMAGADLPG